MYSTVMFVIHTIRWHCATIIKASEGQRLLKDFLSVNQFNIPFELRVANNSVSLSALLISGLAGTISWSNHCLGVGLLTYP